MTSPGYYPLWLRHLAAEVNAGRSCPNCGGQLYQQPGSDGRTYMCDACHIVRGAVSLSRQFEEQDRTARLQEVERQRAEWLRTITPEQRRRQAEKDIEELF